MKKLLAFFFVLASICASFCFASEFSDLLDKAKSDYANGNLSGAISALDSARKIADSENLQKSKVEKIHFLRNGKSTKKRLLLAVHSH